MYWRGAAALLLGASNIAQAAAEVITITQYPSTCRAIYTSGTHSVTIVQSTVTVSPVPWNDNSPNAGTPFVLEALPDSTGRLTSAPRWVLPDGYLTIDGPQAAQYMIKNGQLTLQSGGSISTYEGIPFATFASSTTVGNLNTTFHIENGDLVWSNTAFADGLAAFYQTPDGQQDPAHVVAVFYGTVPNGDYIRIRLVARPVTAANGGISSTAIISSIGGSMSSMQPPVGTVTGNGSSSGGAQSSYQTPSYSYQPTTGRTNSTSSATSMVMSSSRSIPPYTVPTTGGGGQGVTSVAPNEAAPTVATCPNDNAAIITDANAQQYQIACGQETTVGSYASQPVDGGFNECFPLCDLRTDCMAFTFLGGVNGAGPGICHFKNAMVQFVASGPGAVSAVRRLGPSGGLSSGATASSATIATNSSMSSATPSPTQPVSPNGHCGTQNNGGSPEGYTCTGSVFGACCSLSGFCGDSPEYCLAGCQSAYGKCTPQVGNPITQTGFCGLRTGNQTCTGGKFGPCCSVYGTCGSSADYCAPGNCDPAFGICDKNVSTSSMTMSSSSTRGMSSTTSTRMTATTGSSTSMMVSSSSTTSSLSPSPATPSPSSSVMSSVMTSSTSSAGIVSSSLSSSSSVASSVSSSSSSAASSASSSSQAASSTSASSSSPAFSTTRTTTTTTSSSASSSSSPVITTTTSTTTSSSSTSSSASSSSSGYLVLPSPTPCDFGDPAGYDEDDSWCQVTLPFPVRVYAGSDVNVFASTNGYLSLTSGSAQYASQQFPASNLPDNTVAPFFDDLSLQASATPKQGIFYQVSGGTVTFEWFLGRPGTVGRSYHFTVAYDSAVPGVFTYRYYATGGDADQGEFASVGSQGTNAAGGQALGSTYAYHVQSIAPGMAVVCDTNANTCVTSS